MIQIGTTRGEPAGPDEPIGFLFACHGRILARIATLERIASALQREPDAALSALRNTLQFFDRSARLHTEDEETSVFPRLRGALSDQDIQALARLEEQHRQKESVYARLLETSDELMVRMTPELCSRFTDLVSLLGSLYRDHIAAEEGILNRVAPVLTPQDIRTIRTEMRSRRQQAL